MPVVWYSIKQIAAWYGKPVTTTWRHIEKLRVGEDPAFIKKSIGRFYSESETKLLAALMNFEIPKRFLRKAA